VADETVEPLVRRFRRQADGCAALGSPLTAALLHAAATDLAGGGVMAALFDGVATVPGSVPALRFSGALHRLVLERRAPELALHYPSVGGTAPYESVWPVARATVVEHLEELRLLVESPVQTNEPGRSAALYGALAMVMDAHRLPVRLVELGASAGLNLHPDRFAYEIASGDVRGDADSRVRLSRPWRGSIPPDRAVDIVERTGCDPRPVDPTTTEGRLTLTSYVWPDQLQRLERLRAALEVAAAHPVVVTRETATELVARAAAPREGTTTVVWHSVVLQYVDPDERDRLPGLIGEQGKTATTRSPLVHLSFEPADGDRPVFELTARTWPGAEVVHLADCAGHGPPVQWCGAIGRGPRQPYPPFTRSPCAPAVCSCPGGGIPLPDSKPRRPAPALQQEAAVVRRIVEEDVTTPSTTVVESDGSWVGRTLVSLVVIALLVLGAIWLFNNVGDGDNDGGGGGGTNIETNIDGDNGGDTDGENTDTNEEPAPVNS
jgi:hypothetical protein